VGIPQRIEIVLLQEIVDRNRALMLYVGIGAADGSFVERNRYQAARALFAHCLFCFMRSSTERACASSPSARPRAMAAGPSFSSWAAPVFKIDVRFMKSS